MSQNMRTNELLYIILKTLNDKKDKGYSQRKIFFANNIPSNSAAVYNKTFASAVKHGYIVIDDKNNARLSPEYFVGTLHVSSGVQFAYRNQDKFILESHSCYPVDEDVVLIKITDARRLTGEIVKVLKRTDKFITGVYVNQGLTTFVIPDDKKRYKHDIFVNNEMLSEVPNYAKVELKLDAFDIGLKPLGIINRVIRNATEDNARNKLATLSKYGFSPRFSQKALQEAETIKSRISHSSRQDRVLVDIPVFIISESTSSQVAFSCKKNKSGFVVTVYTPDVAGKVIEGSQLDLEAKSKALACCLNNEFINILPQDLITSKIAFSEGQKRLSIAFKLQYDITGTLEDCNVFEAIVEPSTRVNSTAFMHYLAFRGESFENEYFTIIEDLMALSELYDVLDKSRLVFKNKNQIRCIEDGEIEYKENTLLDDLFYILKTDCEMITSKLFSDSNFPCVHSYFKLPSIFRIERLINQCKPFGVDAGCLLEEKITPYDINKFIYSLPDNLQEAVKCNIYDMLGPKQYGKEKTYNYVVGGITCPIINPTRNYAALYNQRLLKRYIKKTLFNDNVENQVIVNIDNICNYISNKSNDKSCAEKEYLLFSLVDNLMSEDATYDALAYSVSPSGVSIILSSGITGLVRFDEYELSDKEFKFTYNGEDRTLKIGDNCHVMFDYFDVKNNRFIFKYTDI